jgi:hypothetical protein
MKTHLLNFIKDPLFWVPALLGGLALPVELLFYELFSINYAILGWLEFSATVIYFGISILVVIILILRKEFIKIPRIVLGTIIGYLLVFLEMFLLLGLACAIDVGHCL